MAGRIAPNIVRNGLVLWLDGSNYSSGTQWTDLSGNSNHATLVNSPTFNTANNGYFQFDGASDYASIPMASTMPGGTSLSLEVVIKNDYTMRAGQGGSYWSFGFEGSGFSHTCGGQGNISSYFVSATFQHYVFTWNQSANNHTMYRNASNVYSFTPACAFNGNQGGFFILGGVYVPNQLSNPGVQSAGSPHIAQLRLYNRILTDNEILQNYNTIKTRFGLT